MNVFLFKNLFENFWLVYVWLSLSRSVDLMDLVLQNLMSVSLLESLFEFFLDEASFEDQLVFFS